MGKELEWIKTGVGLSTDDSNPNLKTLFHNLEQEYLSFSDAEKQNIRTMITTQFDANDAIYVLSCFIQCMNDIEDFKDDILTLLINHPASIPQGNMLELQVNRHINNFYTKKRKVHQNNVAAFANVFDLANYSWLPVEKRNKKRLVIITEQLLSLRHAPTQLVMNYMYALRKMGYEILLFSCPDDVPLPVDLWYGDTTRMASDAQFQNLPLRILFKNTEVTGYQINLNQKSCIKEYHMMLDLIHAFNPYFVFQMGVVNPVADLPSAFTTVAVLKMNVQCPVSESQILLRLARESKEIEEEYAKSLNDDQTQLFLTDKIPVLATKSETPLTREMLHLPEDQFLVAIVGNRLDMEVTDEFASVLKRILQKESSVSLVFIGNANKVLSYFTEETFTDRVFYLGYCNDLMSTYAALDLFLNPKRMGGGFSSSMALTAELPVVTLPHCDVAYNVGQDFIVSDYDDMIENISNYVHDSDFYRKQQDIAKKIASKNTEDAMGAYVERILQQISAVIEEKEV